MPECKRCGRCCVLLGGPYNGEDCPYLIRLKDGTTLCRIYGRRSPPMEIPGRPGYWCLTREDLKKEGSRIIPGCPYDEQ